MDQPLKSPGQSALEDAFHRMFELSRTKSAPTLKERLDRLERLRAAISDNETRFEQAVSADFGHRWAATPTRRPSDRREGLRHDQSGDAGTMIQDCACSPEGATGRANARPMINSAKSGDAGTSIRCPGLRFVNSAENHRPR